MRIVDSASNTNLCMLSKKIKVNVTKELLDELGKLKILGFNVNSKNVDFYSDILYENQLDIEEDSEL